MAATMMRVEVTTQSGTRVLDLARHAPYEHWIVAGWECVADGRVPTLLVRLEGLPFLPSGVNGADYTVTAYLEDSLLDGSDCYHKGQLIDVLDGNSPRAMRLRIPKQVQQIEKAGKPKQSADDGSFEDEMRARRRPRAASSTWPAAGCVVDGEARGELAW